jgi:hypothetical protein
MAFFDFLHIFTDLFDSVAKAWNKLEPKVQDALVKGSGIMNVINTNLQATPDEVFDLIQKKFLMLQKKTLQKPLGKVTDKLKVAQDIEDPDLFTTLKNPGRLIFLVSMVNSGKEHCLNCITVAFYRAGAR